MQNIPVYIAMLFLVMLAGCAHKIDIQQGNVVSEEMLARLEPGMDTRQVTAIMGTPLLQDPFHADRWDYYYSKTPGRKKTVRYGATLYFSGDRLQRIERWGPIPQQDIPDPDVRSSTSRL